MIPDRDRIAERLATVGYVADRDLATALWMMDHLHRPLLLEGEAGRAARFWNRRDSAPRLPVLLS